MAMQQKKEARNMSPPPLGMGAMDSIRIDSPNLLQFYLESETDLGSRKSRQLVRLGRLAGRKPVKLTSASMFGPVGSSDVGNFPIKSTNKKMHNVRKRLENEDTRRKHEPKSAASFDLAILPELANLSLSSPASKKALTSLDPNMLKDLEPLTPKDGGVKPLASTSSQLRQYARERADSSVEHASDMYSEFGDEDQRDHTIDSESEWHDSDTDSRATSNKAPGTRRRVSSTSSSRDDVFRRSLLPASQATPPPSPSKSKLASPKKLKSIPPTPFRPSFDAFWSQDAINAWNDEYSPRKKFDRSPSKTCSEESRGLGGKSTAPVSSPRKGQASHPFATAKEISRARKAFNEKKFKVAESFFNELDCKISNGEVQRLAKEAGGVNIFWSKKLNTTAGRAHWKRETIKTPGLNAEEPKQRHVASIELAEKVIDNEDRLLNVIAHEYCHLANFMISNIRTQPHGASFKRWAARVTSAFSDRGVEVTTKHDYAIAYKYAWACTNKDDCGIQYERHSRSIDPRKHKCGKCKHTLVQIRPTPRSNAQMPPESDEMDCAQQSQNAIAKKSEYQLFVKNNFHTIKNLLGPKSPMKDVMKELGSRYRETKIASTHSNTGTQEQRDSLSSPRDVITVESDSDDIHSENELALGGGGRPNSITAVTDGKDIADVARVLNFLTIHDE